MPSGTTVTVNSYKTLQKTNIYKNYISGHKNTVYETDSNTKTLITGKILCSSTASGAYIYIQIVDGSGANSIIKFNTNVAPTVSILDENQPLDRWIPIEILLPPNSKLIYTNESSVSSGNPTVYFRLILEESKI